MHNRGFIILTNYGRQTIIQILLIQKYAKNGRPKYQEQRDDNKDYEDSPKRGSNAQRHRPDNESRDRLGLKKVIHTKVFDK